MDAHSTFASVVRHVEDDLRVCAERLAVGHLTPGIVARPPFPEQRLRVLYNVHNMITTSFPFAQYSK